MSINSNLKYPNKPILINTNSVDKLNFYLDSVLGKYVMALPASGQNITLGNTTTLSISKTNNGARQLRTININPIFQGDTLDYELGFSIKCHRRDPGVLNDYYYPEFYHLHTKADYAPEESGGTGYLSTATKNAIHKSLFDQARLLQTDAPFNAIQIFDINDAIGDVLSLIITWGDASVSTITATGVLLNESNKLAPYGYIIPISATACKVIMLSTTSYIASLSYTNGGTVASEAKYIGIISKTAAVKCDVDMELKYGTVSGFSYVIAGHSEAGWSNMHYTCNGVYYVGTQTRANATAEAAAINAAPSTSLDTNGMGGTIAYASVFMGTTKLSIYSAYPIYAELLTLVDPLIDTTVLSKGSLIDNASETGLFPRMTGEDVWRVFTNNAHDEGFANQHYIEKPGTTDEYYKLDFVAVNLASGQHGANSYMSSEQRVTVYMKASQFCAKVYEAMTVDGATASDLLITGTGDSLATILEKMNKATLAGSYIAINSNFWKLVIEQIGNDASVSPDN